MVANLDQWVSFPTGWTPWMCAIRDRPGRFLPLGRQADRGVKTRYGYNPCTAEQRAAAQIQDLSDRLKGEPMKKLLTVLLALSLLAGVLPLVMAETPSNAGPPSFDVETDLEITTTLTPASERRRIRASVHPAMSEHSITGSPKA